MDEKTLQQEVIESMATKVKMQWKVIKLLVTALVIVSCVGMLSVVAMYASTLNFMNQYEYSSETTITVDGKQGGNAIYQNGKGNIANGKSCSSEKNNNEKKDKTTKEVRP